MDHQTLAGRSEAVMLNTYGGRYGLSIGRATGARLYDLGGRGYMDLLAGIAVANLGHSHPELLAVMQNQAEELIHVSNLFYQIPQVELAEKLVATCELDKVFFCNSGAEANEAAIKLARRYMREVVGKDAFEIITLSGSFHGRTLATLTATGQEGKIKDGFQPLPEGFITVPFGDIKAMEAAVNPHTTAILIEVVQGEGGVRPLSAEYADAIQRLCQENGVLLIIDEVQTGLCRTGKFWAHQHYGLTPDIMTSAKALANGLPMGAMLAKNKVASGFEPGTHATTFGGGGMLSAVACSVVKIMQRDDLANRAMQLGQFAITKARELQEKHLGKIKEVRGLGLMIGIELTFPGNEVWRVLLDAGFILNLTQGSVLRLLPPLIITEEELAEFFAALDHILSSTNI